MNNYQVVFVAPNKETFRAKDGTVKPMFPDSPQVNTECATYLGASRLADRMNNETRGISGHYRPCKINEGEA